MVYEYTITFEVSNARLRKELVARNIYEAIKQTRKEYPKAHMFIVKRKLPQQAGLCRH